MPIFTPVITVFEDTAAGHISVSFNSGSGTVFNRLKRNGVLIGATIPHDSPDPDLAVFNDAQTRSGEQVSYIGSSIDSSGQESFPTAPITGTVTLSTAWLHEVTKGTNGNVLGTAIELFNLEGQSQKRVREGNVLRLAALEKPRIKTASQVARTIEVPIIVPRAERRITIPILEEILWSNSLFCFRDALGELMFCTIGPQETRTDLNMEMTLVLTESSYSEAIV
jgi:hypothetical protein